MVKKMVHWEGNNVIQFHEIQRLNVYSQKLTLQSTSETHSQMSTENLVSERHGLKMKIPHSSWTPNNGINRQNFEDQDWRTVVRLLNWLFHCVNRSEEVIYPLGFAENPLRSWTNLTLPPSILWGGDVHSLLLLPCHSLAHWTMWVLAKSYTYAKACWRPLPHSPGIFLR